MFKYNCRVGSSDSYWEVHTVFFFFFSSLIRVVNNNPDPNNKWKLVCVYATINWFEFDFNTDVVFFLRYIAPDKREENDQSTHKWMVYVRGSRKEPSIDHFVKKVWFFLHPSYKPNDLVEVRCVLTCLSNLLFLFCLKYFWGYWYIFFSGFFDE